MTKKTLKTIVIALALGALVVASASALKLRAGNILVTADGGFTPKSLPKKVNAPITVHGGGKISTASGELPPVLEEIDFEFDRHGAVDTVGLAKCSMAKLEATTTPQARELCPGAIVGTGQGTAIVKFPEQGPIPASSPITIFNGPEDHGNPTVLAHAHLTKPGPTTFIVPITIKKISNGVYGYRTEAKIPRIAGGYGIPISGSLTIGRKWTYKGVKHSYISARCENGRLQAKGEFSFGDGTELSGTFLRPCTVRG
jgi:hypothetical protein